MCSSQRDEAKALALKGDETDFGDRAKTTAPEWAISSARRFSHSTPPAMPWRSMIGEKPDASRASTMLISEGKRIIPGIRDKDLKFFGGDCRCLDHVPIPMRELRRGAFLRLRYSMG